MFYTVGCKHSKKNQVSKKLTGAFWKYSYNRYNWETWISNLNQTYSEN